MKNIILIFSISFLFTFNATSQDEQINVYAINDYKYIIVPLNYEFLNGQDQYQINSLTKFLFNKYGYIALLENDPFPEDLDQNRCLALKTEVVKVKGGFLNTRVKINLRDCKGNLVVSSKVGMTREKEYKVAYNLAVRDAFKTFQFYEYKYKPNSSVVTLASNNISKKINDEKTKLAQEEIERLKQEVATLKEEKEVKQNVIKAVIKTSSKEEEGQQNVINAVIKTPSIEKKIKISKEQKEDTKILYAQPIGNGFQVVNLIPKVVMILLETPKENTFIVKGQNAIVYKEDGFWYLSKNDGKSTSLETLNIKF